MFVIRHNISADQSPVTVVNRTNVTLYGVQPGETYTVEITPDHPLYTCNLSYAVLTIGNSHHANYSLFNYRLSSHKRAWFTNIRDEFNQANWKLVITYTTHCITTKTTITVHKLIVTLYCYYLTQYGWLLWWQYRGHCWLCVSHVYWFTYLWLKVHCIHGNLDLFVIITIHLFQTSFYTCSLCLQVWAVSRCVTCTCTVGVLTCVQSLCWLGMTKLQPTILHKANRYTVWCITVILYSHVHRCTWLFPVIILLHCRRLIMYQRLLTLTMKTLYSVPRKTVIWWRITHPTVCLSFKK